MRLHFTNLVALKYNSIKKNKTEGLNEHFHPRADVIHLTWDGVFSIGRGDGDSGGVSYALHWAQAYVVTEA